MKAKKQDYDYLLNIIIIGSAGVGKSALMNRFVDDQYLENYNPTIGVDFKIKSIDANQKKVKMQLWDTAGTEKFKNITNAYYKGTHGVVVVFDLCDLSSFKDVDYWLGEANKYAPVDALKILIGNKSDLTSLRKVTTEEAEEKAKNLKMSYVETSAKTALNVVDAFRKLAICLIDQKFTKPITEDKQVLKTSSEKVKKCCS